MAESLSQNPWDDDHDLATNQHHESHEFQNLNE